MSLNSRKKSVVLLSGGMDSSVVMAVAKEKGFCVHALTFDYGQRHRIEIDAARRVADFLSVQEHIVYKLDSSLFQGSSLTEDIPVPKGELTSFSGVIPLTYVPARNTVFLSLSLAFAESIGARDIFIGVSSVDYSGYPDCRPEYIESFEKTANLGTRVADGGVPFKIHAPLLFLTKAETVEEGLRLGLDFSITHSCYDPNPDGAACGKCASCLLRKKGFEYVTPPNTKRSDVLK